MILTARLIYVDSPLQFNGNLSTASVHHANITAEPFFYLSSTFTKAINVSDFGSPVWNEDAKEIQDQQ
jgi:hypothetical protein